MLSQLVIPPGHRITITIEPDLPLAVTVTAYRGDEWVGEMSCSLAFSDDTEKMQQLLDSLTGRGVRRSE